MAFAPGDLAIGGIHEYVEVADPLGALKQMLHVLDDEGVNSQVYITGEAFRVTTGDLYTTSTPDMALANTPHDVDWFSNDTGLLVAVVPAAGRLIFRKYDFAEPANILDEWDPIPVEVGFGQQHTKISLACDNRTVFYTQRGHRVMRYDLVDRAPLLDYQVIENSSPWIYGGLRILPGETGDDADIVIAMTLSGDGPSHAVCLAADRSTLWADEVNPAGSYRILHYNLLDTNFDGFGDLIGSAVTHADVGSGNDETWSLACYYNPCRRYVGFTAVIS